MSSKREDGNGTFQTGWSIIGPVLPLTGWGMPYIGWATPIIMWKLKEKRQIKSLDRIE